MYLFCFFPVGSFQGPHVEIFLVIFVRKLTKCSHMTIVCVDFCRFRKVSFDTRMRRAIFSCFFSWFSSDVKRKRLQKKEKKNPYDRCLLKCLELVKLHRGQTVFYRFLLARDYRKVGFCVVVWSWMHSRSEWTNMQNNNIWFRIYIYFIDWFRCVNCRVGVTDAPCL